MVAFYRAPKFLSSNGWSYVLTMLIIAFMLSCSNSKREGLHNITDVLQKELNPPQKDSFSSGNFKINISITYERVEFKINSNGFRCTRVIDSDGAYARMDSNYVLAYSGSETKLERLMYLKDSFLIYPLYFIKYSNDPKVHWFYIPIDTLSLQSEGIHIKKEIAIPSSGYVLYNKKSKILVSPLIGDKYERFETEKDIAYETNHFFLFDPYLKHEVPCYHEVDFADLSFHECFYYNELPCFKNEILARMKLFMNADLYHSYFD